LKDTQDKISSNKTVSKAVDYDGYESDEFSDGAQELIRDLKKNYPGVGGSFQPEPEPKFIETESEHVIKGKNNSYIVMGKDRPGNIFSGYGGLGNTRSNTIDVVVGRMGFLAKSKRSDGKDAYVDNNFIYDAARIYISQKTNIDTNFGLQSSPGAPTAKDDGQEMPRAAIGMKADVIRIIGRENIRIVSGFGVGPESDMVNGKKNSLGGRVFDSGGIDLIANNNTNPRGVDMSTDVQPLVKGNNLRECIDDLYQQVASLSGHLSKFVLDQTNFNTHVIKHTHSSPFFNGPTRPAERLENVGKGINAVMASFFQQNLKAHQATLIINKKTYTDALLGEKYICSYKNHTN
tara:strand:+ start:1585 stop:2628 length:1044 start_codon:yes stop_codon:yes gene_type:complete